MTVRGRWSERGGAYAASAPHRHGPSLPKLLALARPGPTDRCLDVGTGAGHTAAALAARAGEVIGLDPAGGMLAAAMGSYGRVPNLRFVEAPGDATGLPDASQDLVTARHTLHHHVDLRATLREIRRVLRPGGRLVIVDEVAPSRDHDAWFDALQRERDPSHVRAHRLEEWPGLLAEAGLAWIVGDAETHYTLDLEAWIARGAAGAAERVHARLREAPAEARDALAIDLEAGTFTMPMALILATRPTSEEETS